MLQETVSMTKGTLGYDTTVTSTEHLPRPGVPLEMTSTENKRWLLKSQCDRHIHLGLAVWKGGD